MTDRTKKLDTALRRILLHCGTDRAGETIERIALDALALPAPVPPPSGYVWRCDWTCRLCGRDLARVNGSRKEICKCAESDLEQTHEGCRHPPAAPEAPAETVRVENSRIVAEAKQCHSRNDELVAERHALKARLAEAERLLGECAEDLASELESRYPPEVREYPSMQSKYARDMEPVLAARAFLAAQPKAEAPRAKCDCHYFDLGHRLKEPGCTMHVCDCPMCRKPAAQPPDAAPGEATTLAAVGGDLVQALTCRHTPTDLLVPEGWTDLRCEECKAHAAPGEAKCTGCRGSGWVQLGWATCPVCAPFGREEPR